MPKTRSHATTVLVLFIVAVLAPVAVAQVGGDDPGSRLLNCTIDGHVPEEPARAQQGGYDFAYQSLRGVSDDGRACTVYRLLNAPDQPPTPFRWKLGDVTVVDKVHLPRCGGASPCAWLAFAKYFPGEIDTNLSVLSYGLNADAYEETAETYMNRVALTDAEIAHEAGIVASSVGTELQGTFTTRDGRAVALHLIVKSRFEPDPTGRTRLVYEIDDLDGRGLWGAGDVRVVWDALGTAPLSGGPNAPLGVPTTLGPTTTVTRSADGVHASVLVDDFVLDESFTFEVFAGDDEEPVVVVEMPAYLPVRAP